MGQLSPKTCIILIQACHSKVEGDRGNSPPAECASSTNQQSRKAVFWDANARKLKDSYMLESGKWPHLKPP